MEELKDTIIENGITYRLGEHDLYYPVLEDDKELSYDIGKYGRMRERFLKENRHHEYVKLMMSGELNKYLYDFNEECYEMMDRLIEGMKKKEGLSEQLKSQNQMLWVGRMNNIVARAEEVVVRERVII